MAAAPELAGLGPEPLSAAFNAEYLRIALGRKAAIKNLIINQKVVAGIGGTNSEILFRAGVRPTRRAARVTRKEIERIVAETAPILRAAIGSRGTTFRSYRDSEGQPGQYRGTPDGLWSRGRAVSRVQERDPQRDGRPARQFFLSALPALKFSESGLQVPPRAVRFAYLRKHRWIFSVDVYPQIVRTRNERWIHIVDIDRHQQHIVIAYNVSMTG